MAQVGQATGRSIHHALKNSGHYNERYLRSSEIISWSPRLTYHAVAATGLDLRKVVDRSSCPQSRAEHCWCACDTKNSAATPAVSLQAPVGHARRNRQPCARNDRIAGIQAFLPDSARCRALGSLITWWIGREALRFQERRWFPVTPRALQRARRWYGKYGRWSLPLSWMPIIGDLLTLAAGVMREPLRIFLQLVAIAKTARYLVVAAATLALIP